jgi:hypothetical protein
VGPGVAFDRPLNAQEVIFWREFQRVIGTWDARGAGLGGWTLDVHHVYDPVQRLLLRGDGTRRSAADALAVTMSTIAGGGTDFSPQDGSPAKSARFYDTQSVIAGPDGSVYVSVPNTVKRIAPDGRVFTIAGGGPPSTCQRSTDPCGDGGPATRAVLRTPRGLALGEPGNSGDGGPATRATLFAQSIALGPDGSLYIGNPNNSGVDTARVRRVDPSGIISHYIGAPVVPNAGWSVTVGPNGSVYVGAERQVSRVSPDGTVVRVAGGGSPADGIGLYVYVDNDPVTKADPGGVASLGASAYEGLGGGFKLAFTNKGVSMCFELGVGIGDSIEVNPFAISMRRESRLTRAPPSNSDLVSGWN